MDTRQIMNISPTMQTMNLATSNEKGVRESIHMKPRDIRELSLDQFNSPEVQKLLSARLLVSVTAANEKRLQREKEMA